GERQLDGDFHPAWSPDGEKIAYDTNLDIVIAAPDGSNRTVLSAGSDPDWQPLPTAPYEHAHSANGKIAFYRGVPGNGNDVFTMNPDGTNQVNVTNQPGEDLDPEWSADGQKIAFSHDARIRTMNPDGSGQSQAFGPTSL